MPHDTTGSSALAARSPAHVVITPELLAATARTPLDLARRFHRTWFSALMLATDDELVLVLDDVAIGTPDPLVLEVAHMLRTLREAELDGNLDGDLHDEMGAWVEPGHDPPTVPERVVDVMQQYQEAHRLLSGTHLDRLVQRILCPAAAELLDLVHLCVQAERLLADVADFVRLGDGMIVDARPEELRERRWSCVA